MLPYGRGRHGGDESRLCARSEDGGTTWADLPQDSPWNDNVQTSGILGYLANGTIAYIDVFPKEMASWSRADGPWYRRFVENPTWRLRRFSATGELIEDGAFHVSGLPWPKAAYYCYGDLLDLGRGELFTALGAQVPGQESESGSIRITTLFVRSWDNGKTFEYVSRVDPHLDGKPFGPEGFNEPTLAELADGELLCVMRTGSYSPLYQVRSSDRGESWSTPVSTGWPAAKPDVRLLSNGVLACSSGRGSYGHPQVSHAMFSIDGRGEVWETPFIFHTGPGCSYTSNIEREGKLYVVYSDSSFTRDIDTYRMPYQSIKLAVLDVSLLG